MATFKVDSPDSGQPISVEAEKVQITTAGNLIFTSASNEVEAAFPQGRWRRVWKAALRVPAGVDSSVAEQATKGPTDAELLAIMNRVTMRQVGRSSNQPYRCGRIFGHEALFPVIESGPWGRHVVLRCPNCDYQLDHP